MVETNPVSAEADELRLKLQEALGPAYELGRELGGIESYEQAVRLDPGFALGYAKLAEARYWWASLDPSDERRASEFNAALDRATRLDPSLPEVQALQALRLEH